MHHLPLKTSTSLPLSSTKCLPSCVHAQHTIATKIPDNITVRRSANYTPSKWSHDFVASLKNENAGEPYTTRVNKLKEEVKMMLESATNPLDQLEIIDALQRLGVAYHFEDQIETKLRSIYNDIINKQRWAILEEAQKFSSKNLKAYLKKENNSSTSGDDAKNYHLNMARHALELPLHWRMQRLDARWFIDVYENSPDMKPILLEHAKLDFNMVQAVHQQDLKHASSWWKGTGLGEKLAFVRARPMEVFLWTVGGVFEPQYGYFRRNLSQVGALITVIDDIYDVYSTLDEVELFTEAVTSSVSWIYTKSTRIFAWVSIAAPLLLVHAYFAVPNHITKEASECILDYPNIVKWSSLIGRLPDDLGTSKHEQKRGDNPKSIECYMHESGASEAAAREHIHYLISEAWKKINEYQIGNTAVFSQTFIRMAMNLARMSQCIYQHEDGFGAQNLQTKNRVISLLVEPVSLASKD
ncbi:hypothetical protein GH714_043064 [Hevea brasiliensis]|uniref:Uncharacterized protein n=1 Tax=Hevea brasiliensis TaxID=3981 RepID=A0A6A6K3P4_HEVBR|nr:hypothetical protein GH714_043064 [Hevea brasiliensis]